MCWTKSTSPIVPTRCHIEAGARGRCPLWAFGPFTPEVFETRKKQRVLMQSRALVFQAQIAR